jgi:hypothetical protein
LPNSQRWNGSRLEISSYTVGALKKLLIKPSYFAKGLYVVQIGGDNFLTQVLLEGESLERIQANLTKNVPAALVSALEVIITIKIPSS